jgi:alpha-mannosidase
MTLIRSSFSPDPQPNPGMHHWRYSIVPHTGDWNAAHTVQRAAEFNQPMMQATVPFDAKGTNPKVFSVGAPSDSNVAPTCLKKAEDGKGLIMRMYETTGVSSKGRLALFGQVSGARWVNFLEDDLGDALSGASVPALNLHGFEIRSVRFNLGAWPSGLHSANQSGKQRY